MSSNVRDVGEGGAHLIDAERYSVATMSADSPAASAPTMVATSMRVPVRQGFPNRTSGSIEMPGNTSILASLAFPAPLRPWVESHGGVTVNAWAIATVEQRTPLSTCLGDGDDNVHGPAFGGHPGR